MIAATKGGARKRAPWRVTPDEAAEMVRLYGDGMTVSKIAERLGRSATTVTERLTRAGVLRSRRTRLSEAERAFIWEHARQGWTVSAIAEATGRGGGTVRRYLVDNGIPFVVSTGGRGSRVPRLSDGVGAIRIPDDIRRRVPSVVRRTGTLAAAARELGIDASTVEKVLKVDAPVVLHRLGAPQPGEAIARTAGDLARYEQLYRDHGLVRAADYDQALADYGADAVREWIERLHADRAAAQRVAYQLRLALERAGEEAP